MKLFQVIAHSITVTLVACLLNGFLCGLYIIFSTADSHTPNVLLLVVIFSGAFSAPGLLIFLLCFYIWVSNGKVGQPLFRALVKLAACIAFCSSLLFCWLCWRMIPLPIPVAVLAAVLATVVSVFLHRGAIVSSFQSAKKLSHV
jgi:hypothetical protein